MKILLSLLSLLVIVSNVQSQNASYIQNIKGRTKISLNGAWKYTPDPYDFGLYTFHGHEREDGFFENRQMKDSSELIEYNFATSDHINVPGDWNTQKEKLYYYEGTVWYQKSVDIQKSAKSRYHLHFGAANYKCNVYVNSKKAGEHVGGFTSFMFDVTDLLKNGENSVVVMVNNTRDKKAVPTVNTDWWNYGGITRDVDLIVTPEVFINDYEFKASSDGKTILGMVQLNQKICKKVTVEIKELRFAKTYETDENGSVSFSIKKKIDKWSPENPKLYSVVLSIEQSQITDKIGFRSIKTQGDNIFLNGKSIVLKGICIHEERPDGDGRAHSEKHARELLGWAKDLGCNYVRLAHYPHNEYMVRLADEMGLLVWSEIPVYWTIDFGDENVYNNAKNQLTEMITRDKNRCSIIIWSMANETPLGDVRTKFIGNLAKTAKALDPGRLTSAALLVTGSDGNTNLIEDPLGKHLDVLAINEYIGWYAGKAEDCGKTKWKMSYDKPLIISEFGAGAKYGLHGTKEARWTEEYQDNVFKNQLKMLSKVPFVKGLSPWILKDFRSPRRLLPNIQDEYNRKGVVSEKGEKKKAYFTLKEFYRSGPANSFTK